MSKMSPEGIYIAARIRETYSRFSERVLLRDDGVTLSGAEIGLTIEALGLLISESTRERERVGVLFPNRASRGLAVLAVLAAGRVPVILERNQVPSTNLGLLLCSAPDYSGVSAPVPTWFLDERGNPIRSESGENGGTNELPKPGTALILFTSGSTGERKGVLVSEKGLLYTADLLAGVFELGPAVRAAVVLPICHSMGLNTQFLPTFFAGGESYFQEPSLSLNRCYRNLLAIRPTFVSLIGELLRICYEELKKRALPAAHTVRHVQLAGGSILHEHLLMAHELFPNAVLHKGYGLTEGIRVSMISSLDSQFFTESVGRPLPQQEIEIRDRAGTALGPGTIGQIHVRGPNLMLGYDGHATNPFTADGFLPTGDLGNWTEQGELTIVGRTDSLFKVAGEQVSALEIERAAAEGAAFARDVKCLAVPDPQLGNHVVLFLELAREQEKRFLDEQRFKFEKNLRERFSRSFLPKQVFILDKFPRTENGKLKNHRLREILTEESHRTRAGGPFLYRMLSGDSEKGA